MVASRFDFVSVVAAERGLVVSKEDAHFCRLEPRQPGLAWYCDLDDGTPTDSDRDPASSIHWVCQGLKAGRAVPLLDVRRSGPKSDLGKMLQGIWRLTGRGQSAKPGLGSRFVYTDPAGLLDDALRGRIETWPSAPHGDGVVRPAELWSMRSTGDGLVVDSASWWGSAPALDHQIGLALEIARRLSAQP